MRDHDLVCEKGHAFTLNATDFEDFITSGEHVCPRCGGQADFEDELVLECHICDMVFPVHGVKDAAASIDSMCGACENRGFTDLSVHVPGSWQMLKDQYEWVQESRDTKVLALKGRTDYWEGVIHFCTAKEFASIYRDQTIRANPTGLYHLPAVCLTEATSGNWDNLRERHGQFGYVFRKRDVIQAGGGPAIYMSDDLIAAQKRVGDLAPEVRAFINVLRIPSVTPSVAKHDWLHEREWRVPHDLNLRITEPFGVVLGPYTSQTDGAHDILKAAISYQEIVE